MGVYLSLPPPVKIDRMNPREMNKSAIKIIHPSLFIAPVIIPLRSITTNIPKVVSIPYETSRRTSGYWISLASHAITARPTAQAPEMRVLNIPVRFVSLPKCDRLKTGARIKKEPFMNERMAAIDVIVLYFMISLDPLSSNHCWFVHL